MASSGYRINILNERLQQHEPEAEVILRLGAIANALLMVGRRLPPSNDLSEQARQDTCILIMTAAAHIYVAIKQLEKRHDGLWWKLAERGSQLRGIPVPLGKLKHWLTLKSEFAQICGRIRDKYIFHVDRDPFISYLRKENPRARMTIFEVSAGQTVSDVRFPASYQSLLVSVPEMLPPHAVFLTVAEIIHAFPFMVEAIILGFDEMLRSSDGESTTGGKRE